MTATLSERDLRGLFSVVEDGRRDEPTKAMPWAVLDGLKTLVPCDAVSFYEADPVGRRSQVLQWCEPGDRCLSDGCGPGLTDDVHFWNCALQFAPCVYPQRNGDLISVVRWSDFYTPSQLRNAPLFADFYGPAGYRNGMHASLPALSGHMRKISFWRSAGRDFSERDRLVVELLRPHLWEIYLDAQRRGRRVPHLSDREWEVLQLVDQGLGNVDIAQQLFISVATVRKHLEHIFDRTGIRNRNAAAALMMPHHRATGAACGPTAPLVEPAAPGRAVPA